jgi:DNA-binding NtrC family response regulator
VTERNPDQADIVLVAEDETLVRLIVNDILTDAGYRVLEARDGQEALTVIELQDDIRVLFTDVRMPNLDGLALAKLVMERWPKIGVVITSGDSVPEDHNANFVSKPYDRETVLAAIGRALEEAEGRQAT